MTTYASASENPEVFDYNNPAYQTVEPFEGIPTKTSCWYPDHDYYHGDTIPIPVSDTVPTPATAPLSPRFVAYCHVPIWDGIKFTGLGHRFYSAHERMQQTIERRLTIGSLCGVSWTPAAIGLTKAPQNNQLRDTEAFPLCPDCVTEIRARGWDLTPEEHAEDRRQQIQRQAERNADKARYDAKVAKGTMRRPFDYTSKEWDQPPPPWYVITPEGDQVYVGMTEKEQSLKTDIGVFYFFLFIVIPFFGVIAAFNR